MPTLILLRHAKAEAHNLEDFQRSLALRGRRQAIAVGEALTEEGLVPDLALVSAAARTKQTWELLASRLPREVPATVTRELYETGPRSVVDLVREIDDDVSTLIVVGHEPVMSWTAARLAGPGSDPLLAEQVQLGIPTAARCVLEVPGSWAELDRGGARLVAVARPRED
ncbi:SixA phosphatase family protein [Salana multivorans]